MDKQDKEKIFRMVQECIQDYNFRIYLDRHGALYPENLEFKLKEELITRIRRKVLE